MEIKGKVHCFFEQSGTFKNEFIKLGIPAEDYDIQNNFGETNNVVDLFDEIKEAYENKPSVFDTITCDDLIFAFFPCIFFCENNQLYFTGKHHNLSKFPTKDKVDIIIERQNNRAYFYNMCLRLFAICDMRGIPLIVENPYATQHYLVDNFMYKASLIDRDRTKRGDFFKKPTQYWFVNCENTNEFTLQKNKEKKSIQKAGKGKQAGLCSEERSMISPDYARNFICDFIIGKKQNIGQLQLF